MTYLQIVNSVLRKLRADEVTSVSDTAYSTLISDFVNIAKDEIELTYKWNVLRDTITVNTVASTFRYILTGAGTQSILLDSYNDTEDAQLKSASAEWLNRQFTDDGVQSGSPEYYGINGSDSNGDLQVDVYPIPDAAYNLDFNLVLKQADLSADADISLVPSNLIVLKAWSLAVSERGEDGGTGFNEIEGMYNRALNDAIAIDASNMHSDETTWFVN